MWFIWHDNRSNGQFPLTFLTTSRKWDKKSPNVQFQFSISIYFQYFLPLSNISISISCLTELFIADSYARKRSAKHEDCEKPPEVDNASVVIRYDDNEEFVSATYTCFNGYKLQGRSTITCDLDTDEWQENPPTCIVNGKFRLLSYLLFF